MSNSNADHPATTSGSEAGQAASPQNLQSPDMVLTTLDKDGKRRWMFPRLSKGRFLSKRRAVAYLLIALFTLIPYIKINGTPFILLDIVHRKFIIFSYTFLPTDGILLAILLVSFFLSIFFITAVLGRVWCGWACPQTVYMEFLYRPIERLLSGTAGKGGKPTKTIAGWRLAAKYVLYFLVSCYLAHTFLAYFVGVEALRTWIVSSPFKHPVAFVVMAFTTVMMLFDFTIFREQLCIIACPYGRFQSVLLDRNSLIVTYDKNRGEPRGKMARKKKQQDGDIALPVADNGDCIDCKMCVQTCPTGIDIRDGLQFECVSCTQCIDACDSIMDKIKKPRGLIRYSSQAAIDGEKQKLLRPRIIVYPLIIAVLLTAFIFALSSKQHVYIKELRQVRVNYAAQTDGSILNVKQFKIINRDDQPRTYNLAFDNPEIRLTSEDLPITIAPGQPTQINIQIYTPPSLFKNGKHLTSIRITDDNGYNSTLDVSLLGPF
ncbi:cytochrome c oxidase accessory protein CcoG [Poriferisphaera sp. WC338]|uniref:cytochrome c oxidase accessory protein CcoG n=1 Tax=Poriferisphaera sp. WC338 TaxID=3425129 RepID=UPI003D81A7AF